MADRPLPHLQKEVGPMEISAEHKRRMDEIIRGMQCPKDFECYKSGFEKLSKVRFVADAKLIECLEQTGRTCKSGLSFGSSIFCECPLRNYIAKNFHV